MRYQKFTVNPFQENSYLVWSGSDAVVIDPGFSNSYEFSMFARIIEENNLRLKAVLLTHSHIDHVLGLRQVKLNNPDIPVYLHQEDKPMWENVGVTASMYGIPFEKFDFEPIWLRNETEITFGDLRFEIRFTPGHAPGHIVFYNETAKLLFAGDTLFQRSIGRTDLPLGDFPTLEKSIKNQLYTLKDDVIVLSGHGDATTIGEEKRENPFVRA